MTEIELAWAAGFFDGEGSTSATKERRNGGSVALLMSVVQAGTVDEPPDTLLRFATAIGSGAIYRRHSRGRLGTKPLWVWRTRSNDEAKSVFERLRPYLGKAKIDQAAEAIALRHEYLGHLADRRSFCKRGHEFTPENIYTYINRPTPARLCRACNAENGRRFKARRRAAKLALSTVEGTG